MTSPGPSQEFWQTRFMDCATPWDRGGVNPQLLLWTREGELRPQAGAATAAATDAPVVASGSFPAGPESARATRILVTGCGSGHEVAMLAEMGFDVTAVDFAPAAIEQTQARLRRLLQTAGGERVLRVELVQHDLVEYQPIGQFDAIYEQACLCSIYPDHWIRYSENLSRWLRPGGKLFALFLQMVRVGAARGMIEGPPYHCDINAMRALFPNPRWVWPKPPYERLPHPAAIAELPVVLTRRA